MTLPTLTSLLACIGPTPTPSTAAPSGAPLELGDTLGSIPTATEPVVLPDPQGRTVVLELLRSPEW